MVALSLVLAACASTPAPSSKPSKGDEQQTAAAVLIERALAAGEITADEALAHRVQARFGDPALPSRFAGRAGADSSALVEAAARLKELPAAQAAIVRPYLLRPTDADSAYAGAPPSKATGPDPSAAGRQSSSAGALALAATRTPDCADWVSVSLEPAPFRVWACRSKARPDGNAIFTERLKDTLATTLSTMMTPQPQGMGEPLRDLADHRAHPDNDDLIDIYLLAPGWLGPERAGYQGRIPSEAVAQAIPTESSEGTGSSGYILLGEAAMASDDLLVATVVHEVFHVQQYRYQVSGLPPVVWFVEGTATWAELYYGPRAYIDAHEKLLPHLQDSPLGLKATEPYDHPHQTYAWPLYMQQHAGPESIFAAWLRLSGATRESSEHNLIGGIAAVLPWDEHFPQFALQLLNHRLAGNPVTPMFEDVDIRFPSNAKPDLTGAGRVLKVPAKAAKGAKIDYTTWHTPKLHDEVPAPTGIPELGYRFDRVVVDTKKVPKTWGVELRPDDALKKSAKSAVMDVLLKEKDGNFRRVTVDPTAGGSWCGVSEMYVVMTTPRLGPNVSGSMAVEIDDAPLCELGAGLTMKATGDFHSGPNVIPRPFYASMNMEGTLQLRTGPAKTRVKGTRGDGDQPPPRPAGLPQRETERYYPDAGSVWIVNGQYDDHVCMRGQTSDCQPHQSMTFRTGPGVIKDLEILEVDGLLTLRGTLPVEVTLTEHSMPGAPVQTRQRSLAINCASRGNFLGYGVASGEPAGFVYAGAGSGLTPLSGKRKPGGATVKLSCKNAWPALDGGGRVTQSWEGEVTVGG